MPSECAAGRIRGPGTWPSSIARRRARSAKPSAPAVRIVVNPAISVARACATERMAPSASTSLTASRSLRGSPSTRPAMCTCASMRPGRSVASPRSMVRAPVGIVTLLARPTATIRSSVTTTTPFCRTSPPLPSISRAARIATVPVPLTGATPGCADANAGTAAAATRKARMARQAAGNGMLVSSGSESVRGVNAFVGPMLRAAPNDGQHHPCARPRRGSARCWRLIGVHPMLRAFQPLLSPVRTGLAAYMDYSVTFARHFSRLVWLLLHESGNIDEQKAALRAVVTVSKDGPIKLATQDWRLVVNGSALPEALTGVQDLAAQLIGHAIRELAIDQAAAPADLLGIARILAAEPMPGDGGRAVEQKLGSMGAKTVHATVQGLEAVSRRTGQMQAISDDPEVRTGSEAASASTKPEPKRKPASPGKPAPSRGPGDFVTDEASGR